MTPLQTILDRQPKARFEVGFTEAEIARFEERGFVQIEKVTTDALITRK